MMLIFIIVGTVLINGLEKSRQIESQAAYIAKEIKSSAIIASLSESDFQTTVKIPGSIAGFDIFVDIHKNPDNLVVIKEKVSDQNYKIISSEFLPIIDADGDTLENLSDVTIEIRKIGNNISISLFNG